MRNPRLLALPINSLETYRAKGTIDQYRDYFNPNGYFKHVVALYPYDIAGEEIIADVPVVRVKKRFLLLDFLLLLITAVKLVQSKKITVIRTYGAELEGLLALLVGKICRIPSVISLHGEDDEVIKSRGFSIIVRFLAWILITIILSLANGIWCVSEGVADYAIRRGAHPQKVRVIYNKVKISDFLECGKFRSEARQNLNYTMEDFVAIHVGRLSGDKRIHIMIEALAIIKRMGITNVKLLLVGGHSHETSQGVMQSGKKKKEATNVQKS